MRSGVLIVLSICILFIPPSYAQTDRSVKRGIAAVLFASLGGAVLGLSTLPFYGDPQDHTNNITVGALIGFAAGVGYVAYDRTRPAPPRTYDESVFQEFDLRNRRASADRSAEAPLLHVTLDF